MFPPPPKKKAREDSIALDKLITYREHIAGACPIHIRAVVAGDTGGGAAALRGDAVEHAGDGRPGARGAGLVCEARSNVSVMASTPTSLLKEEFCLVVKTKPRKLTVLLDLGGAAGRGGGGGGPGQAGTVALGGADSREAGTSAV